MATTADFSSNIVAALALTEPTWDTSIGSVTRKIIDAVAGAMAENSIDDHLTQYQYDIDSKSGGALDDFVAVFGQARQQAQRASGVVTFSRPSSLAASQVATIPLGTQVMAATSPPVQVGTIAPAVLALGQTSVDVPVQALQAGPQGNVAAGTLLNLASSVPGVTTTANSQSLSGGLNQQSDADLRAQFKTTVFRNLAGTLQMYRAMALQTQADPTDPTSLAVSQVNVLGSRITYREQVQIVSGAASSSITDAAFIYASSIFLGTDIGGGNLQTPGTQYTVTLNNAVYPATLAVTSIGSQTPDGVYDLQFDYVPSYSRNDPFGTRWNSTAYVSDRVDVWVNGQISDSATQSCVFSTAAAQLFNSTANDPMQATRFSKLDGTHPTVGNIFMPLLFGPILSVPVTLSIASNTYTLGVDYDIVHQSDAFGYTPTSAFGLVWYGGHAPANGTSFSITYNYNAVPSQVQSTIENTWRLLGTDVQVHAGVAHRYRFHLAVVYSRGFSQATVNTGINSALSNLVNSLGFSSALQASDLLQAVHNVPGVDNVRFLTSADDATNYGIQLIYPNGTVGPVSQISGRAADIYFDDATYPLFDSTRILVKARNTFGVS
jgi:uncharacterized phage protein gp47/JayE